MQKVKINSFKIIGISIRTSNKEGQSMQDIPKLWEQFMANQTATKIPNKLNNNIVAVYTNYDSDHTEGYDTILGCQVATLENIPEGMIGTTFEGGSYTKYLAKGDLTQGVVYNTWAHIWEEKIDRIYTADFEIYGEKALNPKDAEVEVLVATKD